MTCDRGDVTGIFNTSTQLTARSVPGIQALPDGFDLVSPVVAFLPLWRADSLADIDDRPERFTAYRVVGRRR